MMTQDPPNIAPAALRLPQVIQRTGLKKATIYKLLRQGRFPRPRRFGMRGVAWVADEIDEWIKALPVA